MSGSGEAPGASIHLLAGVRADHLQCYLRREQTLTSAGRGGRDVKRLPCVWPRGNAAAEAAAAAAAALPALQTPSGIRDGIAQKGGGGEGASLALGWLVGWLAISLVLRSRGVSCICPLGLGAWTGGAGGLVGRRGLGTRNLPPPL